LAGADQYPERPVRLSRVDAPVAGHADDVFGREGDIELEREAHHLTEVGPAGARQLQHLDYHEAPVEAHANPAPLVAVAVELVCQSRSRTIADVEVEAVELPAHRDDGQRQPVLVHEESRARSHRSAGRQVRTATRAADVRAPVGCPGRRWTMATMRARALPAISPSASILKVTLPTARPRPAKRA